MSKKNVAILAGGYSSEWEISMQSAKVVLDNLDPSKYRPYIVEIKKEGWNVVRGENKISLDLDLFGFKSGDESVVFDVAFNAIHGNPGENGLLQGYLEARGIPHTSSSTAVSALTFNKWQCNTILKKFGFNCAKSLLMQKGDEIAEDDIIGALGLPLFVKPNNSGSSFGVTKVKSADEIREAVKKALTEDTEIVLESFMEGIELACGVFRYKGKVIAMAPTEIRSENEFFDYEAKYLGKSLEITPAELDPEMIEKIKKTSASVYQKIRASGMIRVDYILMKNRPGIIEVNTVPGISPESIVPKQALYDGYQLSTFFHMLIEEAMSQSSSEATKFSRALLR